MKLKFTTLDVFSSTRYAGNQLAVIEIPASQQSSITQSQKQAIAKEFNLSETVFVNLPDDDEDDAAKTEPRIDIFTTDAELPFAGHPTIGSGFYIRHIRKRRRSQTAALITKAGRIPLHEPSPGLISASVPHDIHVHARRHDYSSIAGSNQSSFPAVSIVNGMTFVLVELPTLEALGGVTSSVVDSPYVFDSLDEGWRSGFLGTMYYVSLGTRDSNGRKQYRTRMLDDGEDSGTGSASCALGAWLSMQEEEPVEKGKQSELFGYAFTQGVEMGRRNEITVDVRRDGTGKVEEVILSGTAVAVMEGSLEI